MRPCSALICLVLALMTAPSRAADHLNVVASFSILADFARQVGGDKVDVTSLVGPDSDVHVYTPTPHDAKDVGAARLLIVNGLGLEGWLPRRQQACGSQAHVVVGTQGISPRKRGWDADPHAWESASNAMVYVR